MCMNMCSNILLIIILATIYELSGSNVPESRIVGGRDSRITEFPYLVSIKIGEHHHCAGSIIEPNLVITAAHCTNDVKRNDLYIQAGSSLITRSGQHVKVQEIFQHSSYNKSVTDYDVAILKLSSAITIREAKPVQLPDNNTLYREGDYANITGWGATNVANNSTEMQMAQVLILSREKCNFSITWKTNLCAGFIEGGKDACQGDSGGPLVINNTLIGIISHGQDCGKRDFPGVYTEVIKVMDFINGVKEKKSANNTKHTYKYILFIVLMLVIFKCYK